MGHRTDRGDMCIRVFGLNLRDQLVGDRRRVCREVESLFIDIIKNPAERPQAIAELTAIAEGRRSFSMAGRAVIDELRPNFGFLFEDN